MHFGEERSDIYCSYVLVLRYGAVSDIQVHIVIIDLCLLKMDIETEDPDKLGFAYLIR